jgi:hypothetical protein
VAHNVGEVIPDLDSTTVRMIVRPTVAGQALRIKVENTRATTPVTFAAAFVGVTSPPMPTSGQRLLAPSPGRARWRKGGGRILAGEEGRAPPGHRRNRHGGVMIATDPELHTTLARIRHFQDQVAHLRPSRSIRPTFDSRHTGS